MSYGDEVLRVPFSSLLENRIMKTYIYKYLLLITGLLITVTSIAQSAPNKTVPFKEIQRQQSTDNFIAREIKKKELEIVPAQGALLNFSCNGPGKEAKSGKKKKVSL